MLVASFAVMVTGDDTWDHVVNAVILGFLFGQLSFLGHDLGHRQVFRRGIHNEIGGLVVSALVGINRSWWVEKHNRAPRQSQPRRTGPGRAESGRRLH